MKNVKKMLKNHLQIMTEKPKAKNGKLSEISFTSAQFHPSSSTTTTQMTNQIFQE
jgi:hypothetical protein